jgi:proprotein convertase subtilisin/kexin type 5
MRLTLLLLAVFSAAAIASQRLYNNQFALFIPNGEATADELAVKHGFRNLGQIGSLDNYFLFEHPRLHRRSTDHSQPHTLMLLAEPDVKWAEQMVEKRRFKRDGGEDLWEQLSKGVSSTSKRQSSFVGDPMFSTQWHLNGGARGGFDMNVKPAWDRGFSGKGVVVTILDDGIQTNHPDLRDNYDPLASTDINGNDQDPMPQDNGDNKHGTRCAGEVAASANNGFCGVGIAYNASIGGVRMLDGIVNDAVEARALSLNPNHIDIYSASWGPEDDGKTVDGPGPLAKRAFLNGVVRGRHGRGSIFVWASGNGGRYSDNCNCDGYTNSIFTLSISSATQGGFRPWYLEECSSTLASTYSSGTPGRDGSIATVDQDARLRPEHICTTQHTGTSASAPIAAGVCALALEANPGLTWRDMQYLVVMSSRPEPLVEEPGWARNGAGRQFSHKFGYGLMDAERIVDLASKWRTLPTQHICQTVIMAPNAPISDIVGQRTTVNVKTDGCQGSLNAVRFLEHVQCKISLRYYPRGNVMVVLTSPSGTRSTLLLPRPRDSFASTFEDWPFLTVHYWGESPQGQWTLEVVNMGEERPTRRGQGLLRKWQLIFYGTEENPVRLPRSTAFSSSAGPERGGRQQSGFFRPPSSLFPFA